MVDGSSSSVREINRARVLGAVGDGAATSRGELCSLTGLSRSTVAGLVLDLVEAGALVEVVASGADRPGRPIRRLRLAPRTDLVVAVDLGHSHCRVGIVDVDGTVLAERNGSLDVDSSADGALEYARRTISSLTMSSRRPPASRSVSTTTPTWARSPRPPTASPVASPT
jgi:hypothetical protein